MMTKFAHVTAMLVCGLASGGVFPAMAQTCGVCGPMPLFTTPVYVTATGNPNSDLFPATSGYGHFSAAVTHWPTASALPAILPSGTYQAWCGTESTDGFNTTDNEFTASTDPAQLGAVTVPAGGLTAAVLSEVNFILNNKEGIGRVAPTVGDIQAAIWAVLGTQPESTLTTAADNLYQAAVQNSNFTPGPGQVTVLVLLSGSPSIQNLFVELVNCGSLGDRVWLETQQLQASPVVYNTYQQFSTSTAPYTPLDPGINGVVLRLLDASGNPVLNQAGVPITTTTGPSPVNYPYMPAGTNGWYEFTGLTSCSAYQVQVAANQTVLQNTSLNPTQNSTNPNGDSKPSPYTTALPSQNPAVVENVDFGYYGTPGISITCPPSLAYVNVAYTTDFQALNWSGSNAIRLTVTGGTTPYTFSATQLPAGLTIDSSSGAITGTPTAAATYTPVFNVNGTAQSCVIDVKPAALRIGCPAGTGQMGVPYSGAYRVIGGTPPYTFTLVSGSLPPGLTLHSNGTIDGTPTAAGSFGNFAVLIQDSTGSSTYSKVWSTCGFVISPAAPAVTCPSATASASMPYSSYAVGSGGNPPYTFAISAGSLTSGLSIATSGSGAGLISGTPKTQGSYSFTVKLADSTSPTPQTASANCSMNVGPPFTISCPSGTGSAGVAYSSGVGVTGGGGPFAFAIGQGSLPPVLTLNGTNGTVTGTPTTAGGYPYTVQVTDTVSGASASQGCSVGIRLTVNCPGVKAGTVGVAYGSALTVAGAVGAVTFSNAVNLPPGLTMAADGTITGTPTAMGTYNFTAAAKDSAGNTATASCSITISPAIVSNCQIFNAIQGLPITPVTMTASGGTGTGYSFAAAGLPAGVTMSSGGTISGTPTVSGTFSYTVTITDSAGNTGSTRCAVTVLPPLTANCITVTAAQGDAITPAIMTATGGTGTGYTFSATGLPGGVTMGTTGTLTGTPGSTGTFHYTVTVKDSAGNTGTVNCSVTVQPPPLTLTCPANTAVAGVWYSSAAAVSGGTAPYTFSVAAGALPPGLTLDVSTGAIRGAATAAGSYGFTLKVTDANGLTATSAGCGIAVSATPFSIGCPAATATVGVGYSSAAAAAGGVGPYPFSIGSGALATGLSLNTATGAITGTPTVSGTYSFTVQATDSLGTTVTSAGCAIAVAGTGTAVSAGDTATIGFWNNRNGQALILSVNGGAGSQALANWLASQFPYLYGANSAHDLTNKTNQDVAGLFATLFDTNKTAAQIMAGALASYVTNAGLAGTTAIGYGFNSEPGGTGGKTYNVGSSGPAIGLAKNQSYTVMLLLQRVDLEMRNGTYQSDAKKFNAIFSGINQAGDIKS